MDNVSLHTHIHTYIHKYSNFLVWVISVGLASARPNKTTPEKRTPSNQPPGWLVVMHFREVPFEMRAAPLIRTLMGTPNSCIIIGKSIKLPLKWGQEPLSCIHCHYSHLLACVATEKGGLWCANVHMCRFYGIDHIKACLAKCSALHTTAFVWSMYSAVHTMPHQYALERYLCVPAENFKHLFLEAS